MISRQLFGTLLTLVILTSACAPNPQGGSDTLSAPAGGSRGGSIGAGSSAATAEGTITSGGGNTLDGKMTERYSQDISKLPEYAHFILPQLRRLSQDHADVLVAYLQWAVANKAWYFVPVKLPSLPKERIALAFQSDQLALHSEKEIFIDKSAYLAESEKERAFLLMHEMVMGAKLLMKKPPQKQCALLNGMLDPAVCTDANVLKMAITDSEPVDSKDPEAILNGRDHESVRSMTVFLMDAKQNLTGPNVAAKRQALDFNFPWDRVLSRVDTDQFRDALDRTTLSQATFTTSPSFASQTVTDCYIFTSPTSNGWSMTFGAGPATSPSEVSELFKKHWEIYNNSPLSLEARGVLDPSGSGEMVDLVEVAPRSAPYSSNVWNTHEYLEFNFQFYISRGAQPHIVEYRVIPVAVRARSTYQHGFLVSDYESIEIKSKQPLRCRVKP